MGLADLYSLRPHGPMDERPVGKVAEPALDDASESIDMALRLDPFNPSYRENRARLDCREADRAQGKRKLELLDEALADSRRAIKLRPASPYGWSTLMQVKLGLGEIDGEFMSALDNAVMLGPWEEETQRIVADAGLDAWNILSDSRKREVLEDVRRGMRRQSAEIIRIAMRDRNADPFEKHVCR